MRPAQPPKPTNRDGIWYLIRRVPKKFSDLDPRKFVKISTNIAVANDPRGVRARVAVTELNAELEAHWQCLRDGRSDDAAVRFEAIQQRASALNLNYQTATELSSAPLTEILDRLKLLDQTNRVDDPVEVAAVLGGEERPKIRLSGLLDEFEKLNKALLAKKSKNQIRKWRNPRKLAVKNLQELIGDKALDEITRSDTLKFRNWWHDRIVDENILIGTANKNISFVAKMVKDVNRRHQLELRPVFAELRIEGEEDRQRSAFDPGFVQRHILAPNILDGLNKEARDLVYLIADTGMRLSEAVELRADTIFLNAPVPYIRVSPAHRELKTRQSERDIPLVGNALAAMKRNPDGFERYRDKADSLSALVNKYLDTRGLLPSDNHSFYSLRHTFEDRLTAVEAPEKVIASLMGHKWIRPKYGAGPTLAQKRDWMQKIAFSAPGD